MCLIKEQLAEARAKVKKIWRSEWEYDRALADLFKVQKEGLLDHSEQHYMKLQKARETLERKFNKCEPSEWFLPEPLYAARMEVRRLREKAKVIDELDEVVMDAQKTAVSMPVENRPTRRM